MTTAINVTTRSRTLLFLSYRDSVVRELDDKKSRRTQYKNGYEALDNVDLDLERGVYKPLSNTLPPRWVDVAEQIEALIAKLPADIDKLDKLHAKHVLPGFASDRSLEERGIARHTGDVTSRMKSAQALLAKITVADNDQVTRNVQTALAQKLQNISSDFRRRQRIYMEKLQGHAPKLGKREEASTRASVEDDIQASQFQLQHQQLHVSVDLNKRDKELTQIAESITELATLFKEVGTMVVEQGTLLDRIDYNIETTADNTQHAAQELNIAHRYQRRTNRRLVILLLLILIVGLIVILLNKPRKT